MAAANKRITAVKLMLRAEIALRLLLEKRVAKLERRK